MNQLNKTLYQLSDKFNTQNKRIVKALLQISNMTAEEWQEVERIIKEDANRYVGVEENKKFYKNLAEKVRLFVRKIF